MPVWSLWPSIPLALMVASAPLDSSDQKAAPRKKQAYVVAAMGDSLTDPKSHGGLYLEYLRKKCPKSRFDSYGKGGQMVNQMRKRFSRDIFGEDGDDKPRYTHVMVLGGIGDILSNETAKRTVKQIEGDLGAMYAIAKKKGVAVIALTLPPWGGAKAYNAARHEMSLAVSAWIRDRKKEGEADAVVDLYPLLSCGTDRELCGDYGWPDKLHWNAKGHDVAGKALFDAVFSDCE